MAYTVSHGVRCTQQAFRGDIVESTTNPGATPIWARPEPAARRPKFSREQIAAAALEIADAEGFEAVSMRRIAARLGAGTMSLYRYIATKADLLALIDDALRGEALAPEPLPAGWREALTLVARQTRDAYLRHPWAVRVLPGGPAADTTLAGPNGLRHAEQSLAALASAPLDMDAKADLLAIVDDYVFGHLLHAADLTERDAGRLAGRFDQGLRLLLDGVAAELGDSSEAPRRVQRGASR
jgi:AcrR family transcriptional regulator